MDLNNNKRLRRYFDTAYKRHAVELTKDKTRPLTQIAKDLGINVRILARWRATLGSVEAETELKTPEDKDREIERLKAELARMQERELVLKKSLGILCEPERGMPRSRH